MYQNISSSVKFFWQKRKKTAYTAPISSAAAPHFIIQPIPLISRSACAIVFGNMMYQRKASIVFRSFAGQKEKSDHLSGSQLWGIWDKSLTQKKRPIPHSKILITKQLHFLKSIFFSLFLWIPFSQIPCSISYSRLETVLISITRKATGNQGKITSSQLSSTNIPDSPFPTRKSDAVPSRFWPFFPLIRTWVQTWFFRDGRISIVCWFQDTTPRTS